MATLSELQGYLDKLEKARASGAKSLTYDGHNVVFRDISELNSAIAQVRLDISAAGGALVTRTTRFTSRKDL